MSLSPQLVNSNADYVYRLTFSGNGIGSIFFGSGESLCELLILLWAEGVEGSSVALRLESGSMGSAMRLAVAAAEM